MRPTNTQLRWLAVAGVALGLGVQIVGGAEYSPKSDRLPLQTSDALVMQKNLPSIDRQLVRVSDDKQVASARQDSLYRPPQRGAPGGRVGGGTRGPSADLPLVWALVPDHVGFSMEAQPQLVWYLSKATAFPVEFTVIDETGVMPIIETRLASPVEPGMHIIRLADYDVRLEKGTTYQWFVSLISDPEHRSADVLAGGMIQVMDVPGSLENTIGKTNPLEEARLWAQAGFWYDAMGLISTSIQAHPADGEMHALRASLLEEVDLVTPAQVDRQHGL